MAYLKDEKHPFLFVNSDSGVFYVRQKHVGLKPLFQSTGETKKGSALTVAQKLIGDWLGDKSPKHRAQPNTFKAAAEMVLANYTNKEGAKKPREGTQALHRFYIGELIKHIGHKTLDEVSADTLDEVIAKVRSTPRFSSTGKELPMRKTFGDYAKHLNLVMRRAYKSKMVSHLHTYQNPDEVKDTGRLLTRAEVNALWKVMNEEMRDQFVLALECMMRLREAICAPWSEINLETGVWTLPAKRVKTGSKTGRGRSFVVSPNALKRLRARRKLLPNSEWIFPSPTDSSKPIWSTKTAWKTVKAKAGIRGECHWHDLRHTGLTWLLLGDPDMPDAKRALMTKSPVMVSEYAGVSIKTIQRVYLHSKAEMTKDVGRAISIF